MIFLHHAKLVILCQPKTGTTALLSALQSQASIVPPAWKHISYERFIETIAPWIRSEMGLARYDYEVVAVMREPIDWLGSWYRYRTRERLKNRHSGKRYTGDITFDEFALEVCKNPSDRAPFAKIGVPHGVSRLGDMIGVDRLFPYEDLSGLYRLVEERTGELPATERKNLSPELPLELSAGVASALKDAFSFAFELHRSLGVDGTFPDRFRARR